MLTASLPHVKAPLYEKQTNKKTHALEKTQPNKQKPKQTQKKQSKNQPTKKTQKTPEKRKISQQKHCKPSATTSPSFLPVSFWVDAEPNPSYFVLPQ